MNTFWRCLCYCWRTVSLAENKPTLRQGLTNINYNIYHLLHDTTDVNINCQRFDGNTALHLATRYNIVNLVIALIRFGADPYIRNVDEEDVFDYAKKYNRRELSRVVANYKHVSGDMKIDEFFSKMATVYI